MLPRNEIYIAFEQRERVLTLIASLFCHDGHIEALCRVVFSSLMNGRCVYCTICPTFSFYENFQDTYLSVQPSISSSTYIHILNCSLPHCLCFCICLAMSLPTNLSVCLAICSPPPAHPPILQLLFSWGLRFIVLVSDFLPSTDEVGIATTSWSALFAGRRWIIALKDDIGWCVLASWCSWCYNLRFCLLSMMQQYQYL